VQFVLRIDRTAAQEDIGYVADIAIFHARRVGAADDVDMIGNRQLLHKLLEPVGIFGDLLDRLRRLQLLAFQREQLQGEQFRKCHEVGAIISRHVDKIFDLFLEFGLRGDLAHLELDGRHAHRLRQPVMRRLGEQLGIGGERIFPEHMHRMATRRGVARHIVLQHADRNESLVQLKIDHRIPKLLVDHGSQIVRRVGIFALAARIAGHPSAKNDPFQPEMLAQFPADLVETQADTQPTVIRVDADFHAVENLAIGIMASGKAASGNFGPAMGPACGFLGNLEGGAMADNLAFIFRDQLPLGKIVDLAAHFLGRVILALAIDLAGQGGDFSGIFQFRHADDEFWFFCGHPRPLAGFWPAGKISCAAGSKRPLSGMRFVQ